MGKPACKAPEAERVMQLCNEHGYAITVATASCLHGFVKNFLKDQYGFKPDFIQSKCFQHCQGYKQESLKNILDCQGLPRSEEYFKCMVLFDDMLPNKQATDKTGAHFVHVDPKTGVKKHNFWYAKSLLDKDCKKSFNAVDK